MSSINCIWDTDTEYSPGLLLSVGEDCANITKSIHTCNERKYVAEHKSCEGGHQFWSQTHYIRTYNEYKIGLEKWRFKGHPTSNKYDICQKLINMLRKSEWNGEKPFKSKTSLCWYKYYLTGLSAGENGYFEIMYLINCIICCYYSRMINRLCGFYFYLPCIEIYHTWQSVSRVLMRLVKRLLCACHHPSSQHCVTLVTRQSQ